MTAESFAFFSAFSGFGEDAFLAAAGSAFFTFEGALRTGVASVVDSTGAGGIAEALAASRDFFGFLGTVF